MKQEKEKEEESELRGSIGNGRMSFDTVYIYTRTVYIYIACFDSFRSMVRGSQGSSLHHPAHILVNCVFPACVEITTKEGGDEGSG